MSEEEIRPARRGALTRYAVAIGIVGLAAAARWALQPLMGVAPPYITFYIAVVAAAAFGGLGAGLTATAAGGLLGIGLATWPDDQLQLATVAERVRLAIYLASGAGIAFIAGRMHRESAERLAATTELNVALQKLERAHEEVLESNKAKDRFLALLAHELRNPLAVMKNSVFLVERLSADAAASERARQAIGRQVNHLNRLVNDLVDAARMTQGQVALKPATLDLRDPVAHVVEDHKHLFAQAGVRLVHEPEGEPVPVCGDATRLVQVLDNLLGNALKFTGAGGAVHVDVAREDAMAVVRVRDTGAGIEPADAQRIFEPFVQAEPGRAAGGLGLGLAFARTLTELHGGSIAAYSEGRGRGTEIVVKLPLAPSRPQQDDAPPSSSKA